MRELAFPSNCLTGLINMTCSKKFPIIKSDAKLKSQSTNFNRINMVHSLNPAVFRT